MPENLVSRDEFSRPVPRQPAHLHTQAESGAYLRDSSRFPRRRPFMKPPYAIGSVPSLSGHANAYRWRSLPRVRRHRARKPQGSSERVLPWQITMDQLIFASLSHTHYWYEVGMLKVPAVVCRGSIGRKLVCGRTPIAGAGGLSPPPPPTTTMKSFDAINTICSVDLCFYSSDDDIDGGRRCFLEYEDSLHTTQNFIN